MELLGMEHPRGSIVGWLKDGKKYKHFVAMPNEETSVDSDKALNVKDYKDYKHFVGVIGKFDPYVVFLQKSVKLKKDKLTYGKLLHIAEEQGFDLSGLVGD